MFSATTTELSTSKPTQITNPRIEVMFNVSPAKNIAVMAMNRQSGIANAMISVNRNCRRKKYSTTAARHAPNNPFLKRLLSWFLMVSP